MAEYSNSAIVTVAAGQNVPLPRRPTRASPALCIGKALGW